MANKIEKYGMLWDAAQLPIKIEFECIKLGGRWKRADGSFAGMGLPYHYEECRKILWPKLDDHRWHRLIRDTILENKCTVLAGCGSSGKTHEAAWIFLLEYLIYPDQTCVLVSSTDARGLRGRIWSEITMLWQEAREKYDWIPGNLVDSRFSILTDALDDEIDDRKARNYRKCIQGVPCRESEGSGLLRYAGWKQKRMRLVADEACFPAGTLVDTPTGQVPIEQIKEGDWVMGAFGPNRVRHTMKRFKKEIVKIFLLDGRTVISTENHPFFTQEGWKVACHLHPGERIISTKEAQKILASDTNSFLKQRLLSDCEQKQPISFVRIPLTGKKGAGMSILLSPQDSDLRSISWNFQNGYAIGFYKGKMQLLHRIVAGRIYNHIPSEVDHLNNNGLDCRRINISSSDRVSNNQNRRGATASSRSGVRGVYYEASRKKWSAQWQFNGKVVCGRFSSKKEASEWISSARFSHVLQVTHQDECEDGVAVYNLEVEGHPSYSVNGFLVHNSQMAQEFISGITNLNANPDFKCVILGNFKDPLDCLGKCAEPVDGWGAHMAPLKTEVWDTFFPLKGKCVNLIGFDSPNFDFPKKSPDEKDRYPYMIGPKRIAEIEASFGRNSEQFMSQCWGAMKVSTISNRVLTREICEKNNCFEDVVWEGSPTIKVAGLDASWGGDRCPITVGEFGKEVGGKIVLRVSPPVIVPTAPKNGQDADYVIAEFCKDFCEQRSIPPENFFHDSTGRGSLGTALARVWSTQCNPIEFGGVPSQRPVTLDFYWHDPKTGQRRLKLACEHYSKFVTELWFSVRYCAEAGQLKNLPREVFEEFAMRIWEKVSGDRYEVESKSSTERKPGMKQRIGRSPDLADSLCWIGSTLILTPKGEVRIDSIHAGDEVVTPFGNTKVYMVHKSPESEIIKCTFSNGKTLAGRGRHKVFTWNNGWVRLDTLTIADEVETCDNLPLWHFLNALFVRVKSTGFKQLVDIISTGTRLRRRDFYTESSGRNAMGIFRKVCVSITRMVIGLITELRIWNSLSFQSTRDFIFLNAGGIQSREPRLCGVAPQSSPQRQSGTEQKRGWLGIPKMGNEHGIKGRGFQQPAKNAGNDTERISPNMGSTAQTHVFRNRLADVIKTYKRLAKFAVKRLLRISTHPLHTVPLIVERSQLQESKWVYNLTLEEENVYYANGILVENCIAVEGARRRGFSILKLANESEETNRLDWFRDLQRKQRESRQKHALNFHA